MYNTSKDFIFHHIGYACTDVVEYKKNFIPLLKKNSELLYDDINQNVRALFIDLIGNYKIELLQVLDNNTYCPIKKYIEKNKSGFHHICYETADINKGVDLFKRNGYRLISSTTNGFEGRDVSFLIPKPNPDGPLIEIVSHEKTRVNNYV